MRREGMRKSSYLTLMALAAMIPGPVFMCLDQEGEQKQ